MGGADECLPSTHRSYSSRRVREDDGQVVWFETSSTLDRNPAARAGDGDSYPTDPFPFAQG